MNLSIGLDSPLPANCLRMPGGKARREKAATHRLLKGLTQTGCLPSTWLGQFAVHRCASHLLPPWPKLKGRPRLWGSLAG